MSTVTCSSCNGIVCSHIYGGFDQKICCWCEACKDNAVGATAAVMNVELVQLQKRLKLMTHERNSHKQRLVAVRAIHEELNCYSDVSLQAEDGAEAIPAHQAVLATRSPVFRAMFRNGYQEKETGVVHLKDSTTPLLKVLKTWMYSGYLEPEVLKEHGLGLLAMAHQYQMPDLTQDVDGILSQEKLTVEDALKVIRTATQLEAARLRRACLRIIQNLSVKTLLSSQQFKDFIMSDDKEDRRLGVDILAAIAEAHN